jgi:hypothetical protein
MSRAPSAPPRSGFALDILIFSEEGATIAIDGVLHRRFVFERSKFSEITS